MSKPTSPTVEPSEAELEILGVLWAKQPCSVRDIHEQILDKRTVGYTTVLKQVQRLCDKGMVARVEGRGKAYLYCAVQKQEAVRGRLLERLLNGAFHGSTSELVMNALGKHKPSEQEVAKIRALLDAWDSNDE